MSETSNVSFLPSIFGVACPWIMFCGSLRLPGSPLQPTSNNMGILYTPGEAIDIIGLTILPKPEFWNWEKYFRLLTEHVQLQVVEKKKKLFSIIESKIKLCQGLIPFRKKILAPRQDNKKPKGKLCMSVMRQGLRALLKDIQNIISIY